MHILLIWLIYQLHIGIVTQSHAGVQLSVLSRNGHPLSCLTCVCQLPKVEVSSPLQLVLLKIISLHTFIWYQWRFNVLRCGFRIKLLSTYPLHPDMSLDLSFVGWAHEKRQTFSASGKSPVLSIICVKPPGAGLWMVQDDSEHQKQIEVGTRRLDKHLGGWNSEEVLVCCGVMLTVVSDFKICFTLPWN